MGLERVDPGMVAPDQQIEASTSPTSRAPSVRRKSSPLSSESVNPSEMDLEETMDALTKTLMELEESMRERLTIQCGMACLSILEDFVFDLGLALRVCRPALAIEERLESMEKRISVMEEAVSIPLPISSSPPNPAAPAQDHLLSGAPQFPQGEASISVAARAQPWRRPSVEGQPQWPPPTQQWLAPSSSSKRSWEPRAPTMVTSTPRRRRRRGCRAGRQVKSRRQCEGSEPAPGAPSPAPDDSTVLSDAPEVLNDPRCAAGAEMGPNQPPSAPPEELMELTTAAEPQSPVNDPLNFRDVRSGLKEAEKDAQCAPSGPEQSEEATTNEQGTVATCPCPEEAPKDRARHAGDQPQPCGGSTARATTLAPSPPTTMGIHRSRVLQRDLKPLGSAMRRTCLRLHSGATG